MPAIDRRLLLAATGVLAAEALLPVAGAAAAPSFSVRRFGARSDGVTDDSAAVLAAARAAHAAGGGIVRFGSGTTVAADPGEWFPGVAFAGAAAGEHSVVRIPDGGTWRVTASHVTFRDLSFRRGGGEFLRVRGADCRFVRCTFVEGGSPGAEALVLEPGADRTLVSQCRFLRMQAVSIFVDSCHDVRIEKNRILDQGYVTGYMACVQLVGAVRRLRLTENVIRVDPHCPTPVNGVGLAGTDLLIARNRFRVSRFSIEGGITGRLDGNHCAISSTPVTDASNYSAGISLPNVRRMTVVRNTVDQRAATRAVYAGIELPGSARCLVRRNRVIGSRWTSVGIMLDSASDCVIDDNTITNYEDGIVVYAHGRQASRNRISGNHVTFTGRGRHAGISVLLDATGSALDNRVVDNVVVGRSGGPGISIDTQVGTGALRRTTLARNMVAGRAAPMFRSKEAG